MAKILGIEYIIAETAVVVDSPIYKHFVGSLIDEGFSLAGREIKRRGVVEGYFNEKSAFAFIETEFDRFMKKYNPPKILDNPTIK
jgi:hypothetical protein